MNLRQPAVNYVHTLTKCLHQRNDLQSQRVTLIQQILHLPLGVRVPRLDHLQLPLEREHVLVLQQQTRGPQDLADVEHLLQVRNVWRSALEVKVDQPLLGDVGRPVLHLLGRVAAVVAVVVQVAAGRGLEVVVEAVVLNVLVRGGLDVSAVDVAVLVDDGQAVDLGLAGLGAGGVKVAVFGLVEVDLFSLDL